MILKSDFIMMQGLFSDEFYYYYDNVIGPDMLCLLNFAAGRGMPSAPKPYRKEFIIETKDLDDLCAYLKKNQAIKNDWQHKESLIGASNMSFSITADVKQYHAGQISSMVNKDCIVAKNAFDHILDYVPEEIWSDMEEIRNNFLDSF